MSDFFVQNTKNQRRSPASLWLGPKTKRSGKKGCVTFYIQAKNFLLHRCVLAILHRQRIAALMTENHVSAEEKM